ncbi:MAG: DUF2231 domain-containing protein [Phycisphaerales bacterium]
MNVMPPMQPWEAMHPIVVHFPIVLLLLAWVPIVIGVFDRPRRLAWMLGGLLMLVGGTGAAFVAVLSGEATKETVGAMSQVVEHAIHEHEEMGELARTMFIVVTALFVVTLGLGAGLKKGTARRVAVSIAGVVFLGFYVFAATRLAWAGDMGGELVHVYGVRAKMKMSSPPAEAPSQGGAEQHD